MQKHNTVIDEKLQAELDAFDWATLFADNDTTAEAVEEPKVEEPVVKIVKTVCPRCHGKGNLSQYRHRSNGVCFRCNGTGR
jgi:DnaJ-class molecular chaperone